MSKQEPESKPSQPSPARAAAVLLTLTLLGPRPPTPELPPDNGPWQKEDVVYVVGTGIVPTLGVVPTLPGIRAGDRIQWETTARRCARISRMKSEEVLLFGIPIEANTASEEDFRTLEGVGAKIAARIMAERAHGGDFRDLEDFQRVKGIGPKRAAGWAPSLAFTRRRPGSLSRRRVCVPE